MNDADGMAIDSVGLRKDPLCFDLMSGGIGFKMKQYLELINYFLIFVGAISVFAAVYRLSYSLDRRKIHHARLIFLSARVSSSSFLDQIKLASSKLGSAFSIIYGTVQSPTHPRDYFTSRSWKASMSLVFSYTIIAPAFGFLIYGAFSAGLQSTRDVVAFVFLVCGIAGLFVSMVLAIELHKASIKYKIGKRQFFGQIDYQTKSHDRILSGSWILFAWSFWRDGDISYYMTLPYFGFVDVGVHIFALIIFYVLGSAIYLLFSNIWRFGAMGTLLSAVVLTAFFLKFLLFSLVGGPIFYILLYAADWIFGLDLALRASIIFCIILTVGNISILCLARNAKPFKKYTLHILIVVSGICVLRFWSSEPDLSFVDATLTVLAIVLAFWYYLISFLAANSLGDMISVCYSRHFFRKISTSLSLPSLVGYGLADVFVAFGCIFLSLMFLVFSVFLSIFFIAFVVFISFYLGAIESYSGIQEAWRIVDPVINAPIAGWHYLSCLFEGGDGLFSCAGKVAAVPQEFTPFYSERSIGSSEIYVSLAIMAFFLSAVVPTALNLMSIFAFIIFKMVFHVVEKPLLVAHRHLSEEGRPDLLIGLLIAFVLFFSIFLVSHFTLTDAS